MSRSAFEGFGMLKQGTTSGLWMGAFYSWLKAQGFTTRAAKP